MTASLSEAPRGGPTDPCWCSAERALLAAVDELRPPPASATLMPGQARSVADRLDEMARRSTPMATASVVALDSARR